MKKIILSCCLIIGGLQTFSQKVDLDRFHFNASYQILPQEPIAPEERTYGTRANVSGTIARVFSNGEVADGLRLNGFRRVEQNPRVGVEINLMDFYPTGVESKSRVDEQKDKNGKVTSRTYYYWVEATYLGKGSYSIVGPKGLAVDKGNAKEEKPVNRFLKNAQTINDKINESVQQGNSLNQTIVYKTNEFASGYDASKSYNEGKEAIREQQMRQYVNGAIASLNARINRQYGFTPTKTNDFLWILDSKDHPEYQNQQDAIQAVKALFGSMDANKPLTTLESDVKPLIEYFETLPGKYTGDDKRNKKMRYSAYYNLSKIYYYLDQPEKSIAYADKLIANDFDEKDGEKLKESAQELIDEFKRAKMNSRHNAPLE